MGANACDDVYEWAARDPGRPMFAEPAGDTWRPVTAAQFAGRVTSLARGLIAAGIGPGDRVGLMAAASLDRAACDFAIWAAGAVTVPVYETSSAEQIRWELGDSGAVAVFAGTARLAAAITGAGLGKLEAVWRMDGGGLDALARAGPGVTAEELASRRGAVTSGSLATIVYTSGTTGRPCAGPAAIGAIFGSAIPLTRALTHPWQYAVLGGALVLLLALRRGVALTLLAAGAAGVIIAMTVS
jgi:long-chain acyl-CoA synthetase